MFKINTESTNNPAGSPYLISSSYIYIDTRTGIVAIARDIATILTYLNSFDIVVLALISREL